MECVNMKNNIKVLGINCSPRRDGNSSFLLERVLAGAKESGATVKKINLIDCDISPCKEIEYEQISPEGLSVLNDDANMVIKEVDAADVLIMSSPIFFGSLSAQAKILIDRFQCVWLNKNVFKLRQETFCTRKKGYFLSVSAADRLDFFDNAKSIIRHFFAVINYEYSGEILCVKKEKKNDICKSEEIIQKAYDLGRSIG